MGVVLGACALVSAAACADMPTAADRPDAAARTRGSDIGTVEVVCTTSRATPGGPYAYEYGRLTLKLPASTRAADGSTRPYSYRGYAGERVVLAADCTIPNTAAAGEQMTRVFGAKGRPVTSAGGKPGDAVIQSSDYMLEPLHVYACQYGGDYPHCNLPPPPGGTDERPCYEGEACGSDGYTPTGGGDDPDPPAPGEPGSDEWNPDPDNTCDVTATSSWSSNESAGCGTGPFILKSTKLEGCPAHAEGWSLAGAGGIQYYDLRRPGNIRPKSFGGIMRYDVAYYEGTVILADGRPAQAKGEVWCSVGVGIFSH